MLIAVIQWYLVILVAGVIGFCVLNHLGLDSDKAWAGGRVVGLASVSLISWWLGWLGIHQWMQIGVNLYLVFAIASSLMIFRTRMICKENWIAESIFATGFLFILFLRSNNPDILNTEKFMDLGMLTNLLKAQIIPPPDFWLSGNSLAYYYWGTLLWAIPAKLVNIDIGIVYNLIVATLGGMIFVLTWTIGKFLCGSKGYGLLCLYFLAIAGTYDGIDQLITSRGFSSIDIWRSTRLDENVIMEFPLFSLWLGDLHPHFLVIPLTLTTVLIGLHIYFLRNSIQITMLVSVLLGLVMASNPWTFPILLLILLFLVLFSPSKIWQRLSQRQEKTILTSVLIFGPGILVLPFLLNYTPPVSSIARVYSWTSFPVFATYAGVLLVPACAYTITLFQTSNFKKRISYPTTIASIAVVILIGVISQRPVAVFTFAFLLVSLYVALYSSDRSERLSFYFIAVALALFLVPEFVYLVDAYSGQFYRMNTVFKFYYQAWILLSIAIPYLILKWVAGKYARKLILTLLILITSAHPISLLLGVASQEISLNGLRWMEKPDRLIVEYLSTINSNEIILEAVGESYSKFGRISVATGYSAYLGWLGHQLVWRGYSINNELQRRKDIAYQIFTSNDSMEIQRLTQQENIDLIVMGSLERENYTDSNLKAVKGAGEIIFSAGEATIVRIP